MDKKYIKLWELAKPYYEKGRRYDIPHIKWMMNEANEIAKAERSLDPDILLPISILHDVGYCKVKNNTNPNVKDQDSKKVHMAEGANISWKLIKKAGFRKDEADKISYLVSVHDNWVFGDSSIFKDVPEMAAFNDLDYIWPFSNIEQFKITAESMGLKPKEAYEFWMKDEKPVNRPFCCDYTRELYEKLKGEIKRNLD